jgi:hypothetical protein
MAGNRCLVGRHKPPQQLASHPGRWTVTGDPAAHRSPVHTEQAGRCHLAPCAVAEGAELVWAHSRSPSKMAEARELYAPSPRTAS